MKEKCHCNVRMFPKWWKLVNATALLFQMLLGFWGLLNNCAFKKKTNKKHNKKPANPTMGKNVSYRVSGVAEHCIMLHSIVFQISWKYLCTVLGSAEPLIHWCNGRIWSHTIYSGNILAEIYENFTYVKSRVLSRMEVLVLVFSWITYSSLGEWTAVAWCFNVSYDNINGALGTDTININLT